MHIVLDYFCKRYLSVSVEISILRKTKFEPVFRSIIYPSFTHTTELTE